MLPVITIVGRPNVGKSTLFNGLTRTKNALVSAIPGMTRDRQYGEAHFDEHNFLLVDTAGILEDPMGVDVLAVQQSILAVQEADHVFFVVDGQQGLTSSDREIANKLRTFNKKISLLVNKTEGRESDLINAEFFQLGLGKPYPISAAHKSGIDDLLQAVFSDLKPSQPETGDPDSIKLAVIGKPNVGKSTLINRMLGEDRVLVFNEPGTTRDSIYIPLEKNGTKYTLIDTAGIRRRGKVFEVTEKFSVVKTLQAIDLAHVILFVLDARESVTDQDLKLIGHVLNTGKSIVIVFNKWDGMTETDKETTKLAIDRKMQFLHFAKMHFISALHGTGVGNIFPLVQEAYESAHKKISTPKINKLLQQITTSHAPPMVNGRRIKLRYAHIGGHNPPVIVIHGNQLDSLPTSYHHYLENTFQQKLGLVGTPIRIEFKNSENPFREKKESLTPRQLRTKKKLNPSRLLKKKKSLKSSKTTKADKASTSPKTTNAAKAIKAARTNKTLKPTRAAKVNRSKSVKSTKKPSVKKK